MKLKIGIAIGIIILIAGFVVGDFERRQRTIAESYFQEGVHHFNQHEYTAASNALIRSLSNDPSYIKARYWLGKAYYHGGYIKNALMEWEHILNTIGNDPHLQNKITRVIQSEVSNPDLELKENYVTTENLKPQKSYLINPVSIYIDKNINYWVTGYSSNNIIVFNKNGDQIKEIRAGDTEFKHPYDLVINSKGELFVSDFGNDKIHKFDSNYNHIKSFGKSGLLEGQFYGPQGLTIDKYDNLYVVDKGNHRVQKFNSNGDFLIQFGKEGKGIDELMNPSDLSFIKGKIYVSDTDNKRIQIFDESGNWLKSIHSKYFVSPKGIKAIDDNTILIADDYKFKTLNNVKPKKGILAMNVSTHEVEIIKEIKDDIQSPVDVALDKNNFLYIVDLNKNEVPVFLPEKMKYNNLQITLLQTFPPDYTGHNFISKIKNFFSDGDNLAPRVTHRVLVKDQLGRKLFGLKNENFVVYENGIAHDTRILPEKDFYEGLSVVILNEKSQSMQKHNRQIEKVSRHFLSNLNVNDYVQVINFHKVNWIAQDFINNELSPLKALLENNNANTNGLNNKGDLKIGQAFSTGLNNLFKQIHNKKALVFFTSGELNENSFDPLGYDVCLNYAKNNFIPVYIVAFEKSPIENELKEMARLTGGKYFDAYTSKSIGDLASNLKELEQSIYYVQYDSKLSTSKNYKWRETQVEVKLKELFGKDKAGYYLH